MSHEKDGRVKSLVMVNLAHPVLELGGDTKKLPLHITVVPPFRHDRIATGHLAREIGEALEGIEPFDVVAGEEVMLGMNEADGVLARKVGAQSLYVVHNLLMPVVKGFPGVEIDTRFTDQNYTPHATHTETQRLYKGQTRHIDALYLFQKTRLSRGHPAWYVAAKYPLGKGHEAAS